MNYQKKRAISHTLLIILFMTSPRIPTLSYRSSFNLISHPNLKLCRRHSGLFKRLKSLYAFKWVLKMMSELLLHFQVKVMRKVLIRVAFCNPSAVVFTVLKALFSEQALAVFQQDKLHRNFRAHISSQNSAISEKHPRAASLFQFYVFKTTPVLFAL